MSDEKKRWQKGGPSPNPFGRPIKPKRIVLPRQRNLDALAAFEAPVDVNGKKVSFSQLNFELIKRKALAGHAPSQRYADKVHREALEEVQKFEPQLDREISRMYQNLRRGDPPGLVFLSINEIADKLRQTYVDSDQSATETLDKLTARTRKKMKRFFDQLVAEGRITTEEAELELEKFDRQSAARKHRLD